MLKHLLIATTALAFIPSLLAETSADQAKDAATKAAETTKKPADAPKKRTGEPHKEPEKKPTERKPADKKTGESSDSDKVLKAHAETESAKLTDLQSKKLLELLNTGDATAVQAIPGVGKVKAKAIEQARPLKSVADLVLVEGIAEGTIDGIVKWTKDGMKIDVSPEKPVADKSPAKSAEKPAAKEITAPKNSPKEAPPVKPAVPTRKPA